jgi:ATP-dependent Zn protease
MPHALKHCDRRWWKRPPVWFIGVVAVLLLIGAGMELRKGDHAGSMAYGAFLDQVDAGSIVSVTIQGTEIHGRFKQPPYGMPREPLDTRVPDFGDTTLISELRKQHVAIEVNPPSPWTSVLAHLPWPMLVFLGVALVAALIRLARGGAARSGSSTSMPSHGLIGLLSGRFARPDQIASPPPSEQDKPNSH